MAADLLRRTVGPLGLVAGLLLAACGDDTSEQVEAVGPRSALSCIADKGLRASLKPVTDPTQVDPSVYLNVDANRTTTISVAFFTDATGAQSYVELQRQVARTNLNPNDTELVGPTTAVTVDTPGDAGAERRVVMGCL